MFWREHANTRKHISKHSWLSGWMILSISAHLAHLAQSYFFLIFSAINTYNCSWFDLTNRRFAVTEKKKLGEKWLMLTTFFLTATAAIAGKSCFNFQFIWIAKMAEGKCCEPTCKKKPQKGERWTKKKNLLFCKYWAQMFPSLTGRTVRS